MNKFDSIAYEALTYITEKALERRFKEGKELADTEIKLMSMGGFLHDYGRLGTEEEEKPYYEHVKKKFGHNNNEQLLLEDNNYNNTNIVQYEYIPQQYTYSYDYNNYYTPYSYEYDPYIDYYNDYNNGYNNTYYNDSINTTVDLTNDNTFNDSITNVLDMIKSYRDTVNIFKPIKKKIINYISNYRPMYNKDKGIIEPVLIE